MNPNTDNPINNSNNNNNIDQAALNAYVQKRLLEEKNKRNSHTETRMHTLEIIGNLMLLLVTGLFIISPFLQLIIRAINRIGRKSISTRAEYQNLYQWMIKNINYTTRFTTVLILILLIIYVTICKRTKTADKTTNNKSRTNTDKNIIKNICSNINKFLPMFIFLLFVLSIILVTIIRTPNEYDLTGHPYMFESIYSYISYPLVYFFCGMLLFKENYRKFLLYALVFTAMPINILSLINEWCTKIKLFNDEGVCAVFHNSNHYGYYLTLTIITSALLFVYEKKIALKIFFAISGIIGTIVLVINNTLGAYLAVLFVLILFIIYSLFIAKEHRLLSAILLLSFLFITFVMNFKYSTILSSFVTLSSDVSMIIEDPSKADSAGSSRWRLWKGTVIHLKDSPFLGFGVEGLLNTYRIGTPHNEFLQYAEFFGIQTSLLYFVACVIVLIRILINIKKVDKTTIICFFVCIGYLASSFFGVAIYYTTPFIYIFLGIGYGGYLNKILD